MISFPGTGLWLSCFRQPGSPGHNDTEMIAQYGRIFFLISQDPFLPFAVGGRRDETQVA